MNTIKRVKFKESQQFLYSKSDTTSHVWEVEPKVRGPKILLQFEFQLRHGIKISFNYYPNGFISSDT